MLIYLNRDNDIKIFKSRRYCLPKGIIRKYNVIIEKIFYNQHIDSDIKRYKEIRKLTTGKGEDYTNSCLSDYDYIKNYYILTAVDSSRQNELDADPKAIQQKIIHWKNEKKLDANGNATHVCFNNFKKNGRDQTKI